LIDGKVVREERRGGGEEERKKRKGTAGTCMEV
jgi:hypothetical protein